MISAEKKMLLAQQVEAIARKAGKWMAGHKISQVTTKGGVSNVVTDIDIQCQRLIVEECTRCLPESVILAEEENRQQIGEEFTWVIDPIDGTTNYLYDYRHSCVSIALYYQKEGLIGVVYDPYLDECFVGIEGVGSTCNGQTIRVSGNDFSHALMMVGTAPHNKEMADKTFAVLKRLFVETRDIRRSGSAALDLCYLACGRIDGFFEPVLQPWDYGAGSILVRNAGGTLEAMTEGALTQLKPTGIIASNGTCHAALRSVILEGETG